MVNVSNQALTRASTGAVGVNGRHNDSSSWYRNGGKRAFDIMASVAALALLFPVLVVVGFIIFLNDRGNLCSFTSASGSREKASAASSSAR